MVIRASSAGWKAHAALGRSQGRAAPLARLTASMYAVADGEIVWFGMEGSRHPRAVFVMDALPGHRAVVHVDTSRAAPWRALTVGLTPPSGRALIGRCDRLRLEVPRIGRATGLGVLLVASTAGDPVVARAAPAALALATACATDDAEAAVAAATALLGLGGGLTPSGDDYVGAALFARRLIARAGLADASAWERAGQAVRRLAGAATHPLSAALLGDLLDGESHEALHDLARTLAHGASMDAAIATARRVVAIGERSGWDMLAGFVAGITGRLAGSASRPADDRGWYS